VQQLFFSFFLLILFLVPIQTFINQDFFQFKHEEKLKAMEEERPDEMEVAAQKDEEGEEETRRRVNPVHSSILCQRSVFNQNV